MAAVIVAKELTKIYAGGFKALDRVTFSIEEGKIVGYLGPNGAGKTTTINILSAAIPPTSGEAYIYGYHVVREKEKVRGLIGLATQDLALDWLLTPYDNLELFARLYHIPKTIYRKKIMQLLEDLYLADKARVKTLTLSGGEARRLQLARALLSDAPVLFVDEPTLGLDPLGKKAALQYLRKLAASGKTIFLATNEMDQAEAIVDEILFLYAGRLIAQGTLSQFMDQFAGSEVITIKYQGERISAIVEYLRELPQVQVISERPLTFTTARNNKVLPEVITCLTKAGINIEDFQVRTPTLNDAFINLVERMRYGESACVG